ncbi:formate dehydrogenase subunitA (FdhA) [Candidatus Scalindua japonica]|uniref:Formate dehydrogenase subunitA (FdhA) n=1 Tax=Candidatus Scalindua japonica TaxID=1284222 RepID=A0A286U1W9_9BACT|nr:formate dehydrogenase subunit alpha [Candidatus Scalindua japonica]GAX62117.1 formate dehydrogenase subunitA (FdhA) [Candidatus Scalindua japonica]
MEKVKLTINDKTYEVEQGKTVLEVARANDIWIPTLCHDNRLEPYGGCRICLVEIEGARQLMPSCISRVNEGMVVRTETENVRRTRKGVLEYILSDHPLDCMTCEATGCCELQDVAYATGIKGDRFRSKESRGGVIPDKNELIYRETPKCIRCGRCVRICEEVAQENAIAFGGRGFQMWVATPFGETLLDGPCVLCGQCVSACPVGAIREKQPAGKGRSYQTGKVRSTCGYCSIGCQIDIHTNHQEINKITSETGSTPNNGNLCMKGRFAYDFINHQDRLDSPMVRRNGNLEKASWEDAYNVIAEKLKGIKQEHGADAISFISSGRCTNEENYLMQKFARAVIGTNNIDQTETECHSPSIHVLRDTLGLSATTNSIEEISKSDVIFIIGANVTESHPIIGLEVKKALRNGKTVIVVDTRKIWLAKKAHTFLNPQPGTDTVLINAIINVIIKEKLHDEKFIEKRTDKFNSFKKAVAKDDIKKAVKLTGISQDSIEEAARIYADAESAIILYGNGITQHISGDDNVKSLVNLALLTGNIGKECSGIYPLIGQNNGQGAFNMGALPDFYTDFQPVSDITVRKKLEKVYRAKLPKNRGLQIREMFDGACKGKVKAMYVMGADPLMSGPDTTRVNKALSKLDFLVVQDIFMSNTARYADVVLPAACFAEKDGTFTNIERRVQRIRKTVEPPGKSKADWKILSELSARMGKSANYSSPEAIWEEIRKVSPNFAGINYQKLDNGGVQWPCPKAGHPGTKFLYEKKFPEGKAIFSSTKTKLSAEKPDKSYPFILSTGRTLYHFNSGTMTHRAKGSTQKQPYSFVEISQKDADAARIKDGELVSVTTKRGRISLAANISNRVMPKQIWIPFHFINAPVNLLTKDPCSTSRSNGDSNLMPEYKVCAARVEKVE